MVPVWAKVNVKDHVCCMCLHVTIRSMDDMHGPHIIV